MLDVVVRTCSRVHALSRRHRIQALEKPDIIGRCFTSLIRAIRSVAEHKGSVRLHVIDDHSPPELLARLKETAAVAEVECTWESIVGAGNAASLRTAFELARSEGFEVTYFVEDDYLHYTDAIVCMVGSRADLAKATPDGHLVLHPYDCPDRYLRAVEPTMVYFAGKRYWRLVRHTTGTFLVDNSTLIEYWDRYMAFASYGTDPSVSEDSTINIVYRHVPCFSPVPTLAIHLQYDETIPLILPQGTWRDLWQANAEE